jgi:hypothetical protein
MKIIVKLILATFWIIPLQVTAQEYFTFNYEITCENIDSNKLMWKGEKENTKFMLQDYKSVLELKKDTLIKYGSENTESYQVFIEGDFKTNHIEIQNGLILIDSMLTFSPTDYSNVEELVKPIKEELQAQRKINYQRSLIQSDKVKFESLSLKIDTLEKGEIESYYIKFQNLSRTDLKIDTIIFNSKRFKLSFPEKSISYGQTDSLELIIDSQCLLPMKYNEEIHLYMNLDTTSIKLEAEFVVNDDEFDISGLTNSIVKRMYGDTLSHKDLQLKISEHNNIQRQTSELFKLIEKEHETIEFNELFFIDTISTKKYIILPNLAKQEELLNTLKSK